MNAERTPRRRNREGQVLRDALDALTRATGLKTEVLPTPATNGKRRDAEIVIDNAGKRQVYVAEIKFIDRTVALTQAKRQLLEYGKPGVLVTPYMTADMAKYCHEPLDLQFIDTAGNAYLHGPGLYIYIRGERALVFDRTTVAARGGGTATALRVIFTLLCKPDLLNAPYRDIVIAAEVALGAVGWIFFDLENRGLVVGGKRKGNRRFVDTGRLIEEFVTNYPIKLRPKLAARKFRATNPDWWRTAGLDKYGAVWGGEVAADRLTANREPGQFTIYMPGDPGKFVIENRLRADPLGDIEILHKFWHFELDQPYPPDLAPPLLIYADLMATLDPRNHDTAKQLRDQLLPNALAKA